MIYKSTKDIDGKTIERCVVTTTFDDIWYISGWYVDKEYQNQGIGRSLLRESLIKAKNDNGLPKEINYIWNMENDYVYNWLEKNFDPVSALPISEVKYSPEAQKMGNVYHLNTAKVINYFKLED